MHTAIQCLTGMYDTHGDAAGVNLSRLSGESCTYFHKPPEVSNKFELGTQAAGLHISGLLSPPVILVRGECSYLKANNSETFEVSTVLFVSMRLEATRAFVRKYLNAAPR